MPIPTSESPYTHSKGAIFASQGFDILAAAHLADNELVAQALAVGVDVNTTDEATGLSALHIAVGTNNFPLARTLIEKWSASFFPDRFGRWPSLIAAECQADDALAEYIVEKEAQFLREKSSKHGPREA